MREKKGTRAALARLAFVAAVCAVVLATPRGALADNGITVDIGAVDDSAFPEVSVLFTAYIDGRPLANVAAAEVGVTDGGVAGTVVSVEGAAEANIPLALIVVVDVSGSMEGQPLVEAQQAARSLVTSLSAGDAVAVVAFGTEVVVHQELTTDLDLALAAIDGLALAGNTALYEAVAQSAALADATGYARNAVVLLSDGADFGGVSTYTREESLAVAAASGTIFYLIGYGPLIDTAYLEELAAATRGQYFAAPGVTDLPGVSAAIEEVLRSQHVLRFTSSAQDAGGERELSLTITRAEGTGQAAATYTSSRPTPVPATATPVPATETPASAEATATPVAAAPSTGDSGDGGLGPAVFLVVVPVLAVGALATWGGRRMVQKRRQAALLRKDIAGVREVFIKRAAELEVGEEGGADVAEEVAAGKKGS